MWWSCQNKLARCSASGTICIYKYILHYFVNLCVLHCQPRMQLRQNVKVSYMNDSCKTYLYIPNDIKISEQKIIKYKMRWGKQKRNSQRLPKSLLMERSQKHHDLKVLLIQSRGHKLNYVLKKNSKTSIKFVSSCGGRTNFN